jgi:hypothetical protein
MLLSNVNIGTGPSAGNGDPLRTAFATINQNFIAIQSNVNALTNSVTTVSGRTGNIVLTVNDIIGFQGINLVNNSAPIYSNSAGTTGQVIVSSGILYICTAANTWVKTSVTTSF